MIHTRLNSYKRQSNNAQTHTHTQGHNRGNGISQKPGKTEKSCFSDFEKIYIDLGSHWTLQSWVALRKDWESLSQTVHIFYNRTQILENNNFLALSSSITRVQLNLSAGAVFKKLLVSHLEHVSTTYEGKQFLLLVTKSRRGCCCLVKLEITCVPVSREVKSRSVLTE